MPLLDPARPKAIVMWDFSWLGRRWATALDELAERGHDAVKMDAFPQTNDAPFMLRGIAQWSGVAVPRPMLRTTKETVVVLPRIVKAFSTAAEPGA
jgi:hypothetical protein